MEKIEHIGIAVTSIANTGETWCKLLNTSIYKTEDVTTEGVRTAFLQSGPNKIELLEALHDDSPIAKFIAKKGEGIHHIAFEVSDIRAEMVRLKSEGFVLLNDEPKPGADNKLVCFVHPKSAGGVLVELVQEVGFPSKRKTQELTIDEQINLFEFRYKLTIPDDLKAYFKLPDDEIKAHEQDMFCFYKFDEFKSVKEDVGNYGGVPDYTGIIKSLPDHNNCFVFADYSIRLAVYAIRLHEKPSNVSEVYMILGWKYAFVANSFTEFLALYGKDISNVLVL